MNYRHAFHAGNHADVLKHAVLLLCIEAMSRKASPISYLDTHAGRGLYDLTGEEAQRSPEWQAGAARIFGWQDAPAALASYQGALSALNGDGLHTYPGSPWLAAKALRPRDSMSLCELHENECAILRGLMLTHGLAMRQRADIHQRDGYEALRALLPLPHARALVLIDPPYEHEEEFSHAVMALRAGLQRMRHGVFIWWRPLKKAGWVDAADQELQAGRQFSALRLDLTLRDDALPGLGASSLLIINPPFALREAAPDLLAALCARLAQGQHAKWRSTGMTQP